MTNGTEAKLSGLAIAALILSLLMCFPLLPFTGIILGIVAVIKISGDPTKMGTAMAIAAIAIGVVGFVSNGRSFAARAFGDLDCDGILSTLNGPAP